MSHPIRAFVYIKAKGNHRDQVHEVLNEGIHLPDGIVQITRVQGLHDLHVLLELPSEEEFIEAIDKIRGISCVQEVDVDRVIYTP